jgi:hypothetical protein
MAARPLKDKQMQPARPTSLIPIVDELSPKKRHLIVHPRHTRLFM